MIGQWGSISVENKKFSLFNWKKVFFWSIENCELMMVIRKKIIQSLTNKKLYSININVGHKCLNFWSTKNSQCRIKSTFTNFKCICIIFMLKHYTIYGTNKL